MKTLAKLLPPSSLVALFAATVGFAQDSAPVPVHRSIPAPAPNQVRPERPQIPQHQAPVTPQPEQATAATASSANAGFATTSAFTASASPNATSGSTLTAPISITYSGGSPTLLVTDSGTNKGIESVITNSNNSTSALYGTTNGQGAGLTGYNTGTVGPAGKFYVTNSESQQSAVYATTAGTGPAVLGTITANSYQPAVYGQSLGGTSGTGVEGEGSLIGVYGYSASGSAGVSGSSGSGSGVEGYSSTGVAVKAYSAGGGYGVSAFSEGGYGVYGNSEGAAGVYGNSESAAGVYGTSGSTAGVSGVGSSNADGVDGLSSSEFGAGVSGNNTYYGDGVSGYSQYGNGVHGSSGTGYAGFFEGVVAADLFQTLSDRNAKTNFLPIDSKDILDRVSRLPITSWHFKTDLKKRHLGPMAQDFHAAFGLDGDDDKHINLTDMAGISLAAIQELSKQTSENAKLLAEKDARIATLERKISEYDRHFADMQAALSDLRATEDRFAKR